MTQKEDDEKEPQNMCLVCMCSRRGCVCSCTHSNAPSKRLWYYHKTSKSFLADLRQSLDLIPSWNLYTSQNILLRISQFTGFMSQSSVIYTTFLYVVKYSSNTVKYSTVHYSTLSNLKKWCTGLYDRSKIFFAKNPLMHLALIRRQGAAKMRCNFLEMLGLSMN